MDVNSSRLVVYDNTNKGFCRWAACTEGTMIATGVFNSYMAPLPCSLSRFRAVYSL